MTSHQQGIENSAHRFRAVARTLIFVTYEQQLLLIKRGLATPIHPGLYNAIGGHVEAGETPFASALRELQEETGIAETKDFHLSGIITINLDSSPEGIIIFVFSCEAQSSTIRDSPEGKPGWFDLNSLNTKELIEDLPTLIPYAAGHKPDAPVFWAYYTYINETLNIVITT
jgi:8-oxo-dGTP diphosphatase